MTSKTEKMIKSYLTTDLDWLKSNMDALTAPTATLPKNGYLILNYDRKTVTVYGKVAKKIAKRLILQGVCNGYIVKKGTEAFHMEYVKLNLEGEALKTSETYRDEDLIALTKNGHTIYKMRKDIEYVQWDATTGDRLVFEGVEYTY